MLLKLASGFALKPVSSPLASDRRWREVVVVAVEYTPESEELGSNPARKHRSILLLRLLRHASRATKQSF
jgi:hypothetical protein